MDTLGAIQSENEKALKRKGMSERDAVLVSLKNKAKKAQGGSSAVETPGGPQDKYPYGTRVDFEGPHVKALGLHKMKPGQKLHIMGKGHVVSSSKDESLDGEPRHRVSVQMTHMAPVKSKGFASGDYGVKPDSAEDLDGEEQD